jgi:hypothetical protein
MQYSFQKDKKKPINSASFQSGLPDQSLILKGLLLGGSANGAGAGTGAAFDAGFRIDFVLSVSLGDRGNRALGSARAAADAFVGNFVSHEIPPFVISFLWNEYFISYFIIFHGFLQGENHLVQFQESPSIAFFTASAQLVLPGFASGGFSGSFLSWAADGAGAL